MNAQATISLVAILAALLLLAGAVLAFLKRDADWIERNPDRVEFNYISRGPQPDVVEVWAEGELLLSYFWQDGAMASPTSPLGRIHAMYQSREIPA